MEFITAASAPPPLPPPVKQYQSQAVIHLTSNDRRGSTSGEDKPGLIRSISRGSLGRRSSTGGGSESGGGLRRVLSRGEGESGGGLRRVLSRGDKSGADGSGRRSSDGNVLKHAETAPTTEAPPLQRTKSSDLKTGKWISPVMAGVAGNSLVLILAVGSHLVPFSSFEETRHQVRRASTTGTAPASAAPAAQSETEHGSGGGGGIGATIKKMFRRTSTSQQGTAHAADAHPNTTSGAESAVSDETAVNAPLNTLEGHHQLEEQTQDMSYPAYVHGSPVKYIVVPLGALDYKTITIKEEKGVWVVKVPVTGFFHRLVEPALAEIGQGPDEGWGRSGDIEFLFDSKNWIGAKDEAELLHYSLMSALNPTAM